MKRWAEVAERLPLPEYLTAYGELLQSLGRDAEAQAQFSVVRGAATLARSNGVGVDLELALFEADHGAADAAVTAAQAEWDRRHSIHVADALGWALHAAGRDADALRYAKVATSLGTRDATMLYHRGRIEQELGNNEQARRYLRAALRTDPHFSPLHAPRAEAALISMGDAR